MCSNYPPGALAEIQRQEQHSHEFDAVYMANVHSETAYLNACIADGSKYQDRFDIAELMTTEITDNPESLKKLQASVLMFLRGQDAEAALLMKHITLGAKAVFINNSAKQQAIDETGLLG